MIEPEAAASRASSPPVFPRQASYSYTNVDRDFVVMVNADKVKFTAEALRRWIYYWHTGHPGGVTTDRQPDPRRKASACSRNAKRMLPKKPRWPISNDAPRALQRAEHPHAARTRRDHRVRRAERQGSVQALSMSGSHHA